MLSIVIPAYNEEGNIPTVYREIVDAVPEETDPLEIIFVDDGSRDGTFSEIEKLSMQDSRVKGIRLSRNFGHQVALYAGLNEAGGDRVITMDADGQHPASLIPALTGKLDEGYDIVNTIRLETEGVGGWKKTSSRWFYRLFNALSDVRIEPSSADFRIMSRKALKAFLSMEEHDRFTRGIVSWMGFRQATVEYSADRRRSGKSKYSFRKMRVFALDGITSFSSKPLRISMALGLIVFFAGLVYMLYAVIMYFLGRTNPGWTSLLITILILGGVQLLILGIIGEYLARIFNETKRRPHYFIERRTGEQDG